MFFVSSCYCEDALLWCLFFVMLFFLEDVFLWYNCAVKLYSREVFLFWGDGNMKWVRSTITGIYQQKNRHHNLPISPYLICQYNNDLLQTTPGTAFIIKCHLKVSTQVQWYEHRESPSSETISQDTPKKFSLRNLKRAKTIQNNLDKKVKVYYMQPFEKELKQK